MNKFEEKKLQLVEAEHSTRTFEKVDSRKQKDFLHAHNNCILCGDTLSLHHMQAPDKMQIKEEAFCQACDVRARTKSYTLH